MSPQRLEAALGYVFKRPDLLRQALTHRSHSSTHNERLEFLGDSVLNCAIAAELYARFEQIKEGELSRLRATLVRQDALAEVAQRLDLGAQLKLGEGELKSGGVRRPSILADALEAIFGAIYLDAGFESANDVIVRLFEPLLARIDPAKSGKDAKTSLQEWLQARRMDLPRYTLQATRGEAHVQLFEVECAVPRLGLRATGSGSSRRLAEQAAAQRLLAEINQDIKS